MSTRSRRSPRALSLEQLEPRYALAGDVFVDVKNGTLLVRGDSAANQISIQQESAGTFVISGNDVNQPERFHLNGVPLGAGVHQVTARLIYNDIKLDLQGGDDKVEIVGSVKTALLARNVIVSGGTGADQITIADGFILGKLTIDSGKKDATLAGDRVTIRNVTVFGSASVTTGGGGDTVTVSQATLGNKVAIKTGQGNDQTIVDGNTVFAKSLSIHAGQATGGGDRVRIVNGVKVLGAASLTTGNGDDYLELGDATFRKLTIKTAAGDDRIDAGFAGASVVDWALISLGKGDNVVNVGEQKLTLNGPQRSKLAGSPGINTVSGTSNIGNFGLVSVSGVKPAGDPAIAALVSAVSSDRLVESVQTLAAFPTRHTLSPHNVAAGNWLREQFLALGYTDVQFHQFTIAGVTRQNVVVTKQGSVHPSKYILVGAHYDSRSNSNVAPGADDNASGTAALLELARVLRTVDTPYSIRFVAFSGEEQGLVGSTAYANAIHAQGVDLRLMINLDMIGHPANAAKPTIIIERDVGNFDPTNDARSHADATLMAAAAATYTSLRTKFGPIYDSDYMPFERLGYVSIGAFDGADNQSFHDHETDTPDKVNPSFHVEVVRMVLATILTIADH